MSKTKPSRTNPSSASTPLSASTPKPSKSHTTVPSHPTGITKRRPTAKPLSRAQRLRKEKGVERAEQVIDRTSKKVERSAKRLGTRRGRRREWEDVNGDAGVAGLKKKIVAKDEGEDDGAMDVEEGAAGEGGVKKGGETTKALDMREGAEWVDEESDEGEDEVVKEIRSKPVVLETGNADNGGAKGLGAIGDQGGQKEEEEL